MNAGQVLIALEFISRQTDYGILIGTTEYGYRARVVNWSNGMEELFNPPVVNVERKTIQECIMYVFEKLNLKLPQ